MKATKKVGQGKHPEDKGGLPIWTGANAKAVELSEVCEGNGDGVRRIVTDNRLFGLPSCEGMPGRKFLMGKGLRALKGRGYMIPEKVR